METKKKLKLLMLEDLDEDAELITRSLKKDGLLFEYLRVETGEEFIDALSEGDFDAVLSDHSLPRFNSTEALKICQERQLVIPFILITGTVSEEFAVTCLKQGADDYILKSNLSRLPSAIKNALRQRKLERQRRRAEKELRDQNKELKKINQELDNFVYSVSHNLRAPLTSVLGLLNLARHEDRNRDGHFYQYFQMMDQSILKLDETLKEIIDYSRNAREEIANKSVHVHHLITSSLEQFHYLPGFEKLKKTIAAPEDLTFRTDVHRLTVIVNNLISNAIKYGDEQKPEPTLTITASSGAENSLVLEIEDNGIGIKAECVGKIFNMFYRGTEKSTGAGLGLYIAKETVTRLRGKISVQSEFGSYTRFRVELPERAVTPVPEAEEPDEVADSSSEAPYQT